MEQSTLYPQSEDVNTWKEHNLYYNGENSHPDLGKTRRH